MKRIEKLAADTIRALHMQQDAFELGLKSQDPGLVGRGMEIQAYLAGYRQAIEDAAMRCHLIEDAVEISTLPDQDE